MNLQVDGGRLTDGVEFIMKMFAFLGGSEKYVVWNIGMGFMLESNSPKNELLFPRNAFLVHVELL